MPLRNLKIEACNSRQALQQHLMKNVCINASLCSLQINGRFSGPTEVQPVSQTIGALMVFLGFFCSSDRKKKLPTTSDCVLFHPECIDNILLCHEKSGLQITSMPLTLLLFSTKFISSNINDT